MASETSPTAPERPSGRTTRRRWLRQAAASGLLLGVSSAAYAWRVEPHWVTIRHQPMPLRRLPDGLIGKRLVQISDLHVGPIVDNGYLRGVLGRLAELQPDYLAITGDFMTCHRDEQVDLTLRTLQTAPIADVPTFAVLGNHDYGETFSDFRVAASLAKGLRGLGITVLRNSSVEVDGLQIAGCEDLWSGGCNLPESLMAVDHQAPTIYLAHNPDTVDLAPWSTFGGWILSGHTHGGQCRLPLLGAPFLPVRNQLYDSGHFRLNGGRNLYVNPGLGYKRRLRFGVRPEVTVFTLTAA